MSLATCWQISTEIQWTIQLTLQEVHYTARAIEALTTGTIAACETLSTLVYTLVLYTTCAQMYKIGTWVRT